MDNSRQIPVQPLPDDAAGKTVDLVAQHGASKGHIIEQVRAGYHPLLIFHGMVYAVGNAIAENRPDPFERQQLFQQLLWSLKEGMFPEESHGGG